MIMLMNKNNKTIGGQAVIEGVLMRDKEHYSIATRKNNKIKTIRKKIKQPNKFWKIPFFRGIYSLFETLIIGIKALNYSAKQQEEKKDEIKTWHLVFTLILAVIFALIIFKLIPLGIAQLFSGFNNLFQNNIIFNLIEGAFKILQERQKTDQGHDKRQKETQDAHEDDAAGRLRRIGLWIGYNGP